MPKVLLAFSGGLDTRFCIPWLQEKGYDVVTLTLNTGGFSPDEMDEIEATALAIGSSKHIALNVETEIYDQYISSLIQANGLYQGRYPVMCIDRYLIAEKSVEYARIEGCTAVATGNTGQGNDQVRVDLALSILGPELSNIAPIRETGITRAEELAYLQAKGFDAPPAHKRYSKNENVLGVTTSGSEIDLLKEPAEEAFELTKLTASEPMYVELEFEGGEIANCKVQSANLNFHEPSALSHEQSRGIDTLKKLNHLVGSYGVGRDNYIGDCMIGIKGAIWFEAPGMLTLIKAHQALEELVLTKAQRELKAVLDRQLAEYAYNGKFFDPVVADIQAFQCSANQFVTGTVKLKLSPHRLEVVEITSPNSLIRRDIADYAQKASWKGKEVEGFIKLYGLGTVIARKRKDAKGEGL